MPKITLNDAIKNKDNFFSELTYSSYKHNRQRSPQFAPEKWCLLFPDWQVLENRYQEEIKQCKA